MDFIKDIIHFIVERRKYWLIPLILSLLLLGLIVFMVETAPILPVIYPVF